MANSADRAWSKNIHPDTGKLYIDLGEDHEGYTRYVWFAGDMEVYDMADFEAADKMAAALDLYEAAKAMLLSEDMPTREVWELLEQAVAKAKGREDVA